MTFLLFDPQTPGVSLPAGQSIIAPSLGAVLALGTWVPHREYVTCMRARGHYAEYGEVTLVKNDSGAFRGEIRPDDLQVRSTATPQGDAREDPDGGTQLLFAPGERVISALVVAGSTARHRVCTASWSKEGEHPAVQQLIDLGDRPVIVRNAEIAHPSSYVLCELADYTRPRRPADQGQQTLVAHLSGYTSHQDIVPDVRAATIT